MKRFLLTLMILGLATLIASPAAAVTWNHYDFGDNVFDEHNNTADVFFPSYGYVPSPNGEGDGGELYDIEGLNFAFDNSYIYISLTNSFGEAAYSPTWEDNYASGDLFFGFDGALDFAIDVSAGQLFGNVTGNDITDKDGTYYNNVTIRNAVGPYQIADGDLLGSANKILTGYDGLELNPMSPGNGDTSIFEFKLSLADLGVTMTDYQSISFHNTVECGNDLLEEDHNIVPEPTTMILLGLGLMGVGARLRRRK